MADAGLLIGWNRVVSGRDDSAVDLWNEMLTYFRRLHAEGRIERFEPVILGAHGGQLNGFVLLRGSQEHLDQIRNSEEFLVLNVRAQRALEGFMVVRAHHGDEAQKILRIYGQR
ncbi:MAG: hypothetical protein AAF602_07075 [Myxococcota bacterium]